jgi:hypothetical protein
MSLQLRNRVVGSAIQVLAWVCLAAGALSFICAIGAAVTAPLALWRHELWIVLLIVLPFLLFPLAPLLMAMGQFMADTQATWPLHPLRLRSSRAKRSQWRPALS